MCVRLDKILETPAIHCNSEEKTMHTSNERHNVVCVINRIQAVGAAVFLYRKHFTEDLSSQIPSNVDLSQLHIW